MGQDQRGGGGGGGGRTTRGVAVRPWRQRRLGWSLDPGFFGSSLDQESSGFGALSSVVNVPLVIYSPEFFWSLSTSDRAASVLQAPPPAYGGRSFVGSPGLHPTEGGGVPQNKAGGLRGGCHPEKSGGSGGRSSQNESVGRGGCSRLLLSRTNSF
jgi:hypothetical protein